MCFFMHLNVVNFLIDFLELHRIVRAITGAEEGCLSVHMPHVLYRYFRRLIFSRAVTQAEIRFLRIVKHAVLRVLRGLDGIIFSIQVF